MTARKLNDSVLISDARDAFAPPTQREVGSTQREVGSTNRFADILGPTLMDSQLQITSSLNGSEYGRDCLQAARHNYAKLW